jgi:predicted O-linked N-acetylglucosamine transferase (SPINDLY family)
LSAQTPTPEEAGVHYRAGRLGEAELACRAILERDPGHPEALHWLALMALDAGQNETAAELYSRAIACAPQNPVLHHNLGEAFRRQERMEDAVRCYRRAVELKPGYAQAHFSLGNGLGILGDVDGAIAHYRQALAIQPDFPQAHNNHGNACKALGLPEEAEQCYRRALALWPEFEVAHSNLIFTMDLLERYGVAEQQAERRRWYERHALKFGPSIRQHENIPDSGRKLRIGYVSADFRRQSACMAFGPVICLRDRASFEAICYSGVTKEDEVTARLRAAADGWRSTVGVSDDALSDTIRRDRIDILVDLSGHMAGNRLLVFARKPAPVQVSAWGNVTGTGLESMDYLFAEALTIPAAERPHFAEKVIDLPATICYEPPEYLPEVSPLPALERGSLTFGCANRPEKISDRVIALWGRILAQFPASRLLLKGQGLGGTGLRHRMLERLAGAGIPPKRALLLGGSPHVEHLKTYHMVDVALDPYPHGGGITTAEALAMGVPVVTLMGGTLPSRISASFLNALGMPEWIARTDEEYVQIALAAAQDLPRLARLREHLRARFLRSPIGDLQGYTRAVERAYRAIWQRWCDDHRSA